MIRNPYSQMLVSLPASLFAGRSADLETLLQGISAAEPRSFAIQGPKTIGKTALLNYLCNPQGALQAHGRALLQFGPGREGALEFVYIDFYSVDGSAALGLLYNQLLDLDRRLGSRSGARPATPAPSSGERAPVKEALLALCRRWNEQGVRLVVCLDHFDRSFSTLEYEDDIFLRSLTSYQAFIVVTEKRLADLRKDPRRTSPLLNVLLPRTLGLLPESEARQLIEKPAPLMEKPFSAVEVDFLLQVAGRHPYLLTLACEYLYTLRLQYDLPSDLLKGKGKADQMKAQIAAITPVNELFQLFWSRLAPAERQVLAEVAAGREQPNGLDPLALNSLRQQSLLVMDLPTGRYHVFSELFRDYILQQRQPARRQGLEEIASDLPQLDRRLLEYLMERPNQVLPFEELLGAIWGDPGTSKRGLEAAVHRLRTRIQDVEGRDWEYIQNVRGKGFQYVPRS